MGSSANGKSPLAYLVNSELSKMTYYVQPAGATPALSSAVADIANGQTQIGEAVSTEASEIPLLNQREKKVPLGPEWTGKAAKALGLTGNIDVTGPELENLARGYSPDGGTALVKVPGDEHRTGYDVTLSPNKYYSACWAGADSVMRAKLDQLHRDAVDRTIRYLEELAITRVGTGGIDRQKVKGLVCAKFEHCASRELDPQRHTHVVVMNVCERQDGTWGTIESKPFFEHMKDAGALYRSELAAGLRQLGFDVRRDSKDNFTLGGLTEKQMNELSTRRAQILAHLEKMGGRSALAAQFANLATRKEKDEPPLAEMMAAWTKQLNEMMITPTAIRRMTRLGRREAADLSVDIVPVLKEICEQRSTFLDRDLIRLLAIHSVGIWNADQVLEQANKILASSHVVSLGMDRDGNRRFTTPEMFALEVAAGERAIRMKSNREHVVAADIVDKCITAREAVLSKQYNKPIKFTEQRTAIEHLCTATGAIAICEGWAGAGKTTMLEAAANAWRASDLKPIGCALAGKAAEGLEKESGIPSRTIDSLFKAIENERFRLTNQHVLVVDEAGMVGSRMMGRILAYCEAAGAKLCLVGDPKQLQAIDAGQMMRSLQKRVGYTELKNINRQQDRGELKGAWMIDPIKRLAIGDGADALREFDKRGMVEIKPDLQSTVTSLINEWKADTKTDIKNKLIIAGTLDESHKLNLAARAAMGEQGKLDLSKQAKIFLDDAKRNYREFAVNERVMFTRNNDRLGVKNGQLGTIVSIKPGDKTTIIKVAMDDGKRFVTFNAAEMRDIDYGWCVTCHKSQGVTVDKSYVMVNESMSTQEWSYVAASRARFSTKIYAVERDVSHLLTEQYDAARIAVRQAQDAEERDKALIALKNMERDAQLKVIGERMERSGAKDTSLDYEKGREAVPTLAGLRAEEEERVAAEAKKAKKAARYRQEKDQAHAASKQEPKVGKATPKKTTPAAEAPPAVAPAQKGHFNPDVRGIGATPPTTESNAPKAKPRQTRGNSKNPNAIKRR